MTTVVLDSGVRRYRDGRVLLGGSPTRLLRLGERGVRQVERWLAGMPVGNDAGERALAQRLIDAGIVHPVAGPGPTTADDVSLVVPVKDNPRGVARLLTVAGEFAEKIVVDDGSAIPVMDARIRHSVPRGPAAARNSGLRCADTPLIAFLDSDTIPEPGWLASVLPLFDDPRVAAVAPRIRSLPHGPLGRYEVDHGSLDMGPNPAVVRAGGRVRYVPSTALVVRRDVLLAVGGFDESLRFGEDVDLIWRLIESGNVVRYQPDSTVWHEPRETVGAWLRQRFDYGTSAAPLSLRHRGQLACAVLSRPQAAQALLVTARRPATAAAVVTVASGSLAQQLHRRGVPPGTALALAGGAQLAAIKQLADAARRVWWPLLLCTRRGRAVFAAALAPIAVECIRNAHGPRWAALRLADDLAYALGVWAGCARHRTVAPLLPQLRSGSKQ
ncbi:mycofactocin biosynthesis glycosyltransferase MftF [Nocardia sp. NPDC059246]|uniref:mycofactocin biosynthesis glycosyltransferase MftF n=1 Tax=unclassified Nocardia TaxID=2637762 RepID=UPI0036AA0B00